MLPVVRLFDLSSFYSDFPSSLQRSSEQVLAGLRKANRRRPHTSATTWNGEEDIRSLGNELLLNFRCKHQFPYP